LNPEFDAVLTIDVEVTKRARADVETHERRREAESETALRELAALSREMDLVT
jgi:hypothetical protein